MMSIRTRSGNPTIRIAGLAAPTVIGLLAAIGNPVLDTMMVARFSATDLAALAVGASIYITILVPFVSVMQSLTPTFGQLFGAGKFDEMHDTFKQGLWLALFIAIPASTILSVPWILLSLAKPPPALVEIATLYLRVLAFSLPATLCFFVYNTLNHAIARPKMVMLLQVSGLFLKIPLNLIFIFGYFGVPAFGGVGCAIATLILTWCQVVASMLILRHDPFYTFLRLFPAVFVGPRWRNLKELFRLGLPMGMNSFIETTSFTFMALFIARIGIDTVAGHQIIANISSVLYMLPLATASATMAMVAQSIGAKRLDIARKMAFSGQRLAACIALFVGFTVWLFSHHIIGLYTSDPEIVAVARGLILFVCSFQLFFALQITSAYILRAYKVVLAPTVLYFLTFWCVGLGGGYILAFNVLDLDLPLAITGAGGFWFGYAVSSLLQSSSLMILKKYVQDRADRNTPSPPP